MNNCARGNKWEKEGKNEGERRKEHDRRLKVGSWNQKYEKGGIIGEELKMENGMKEIKRREESARKREIGRKLRGKKFSVGGGGGGCLNSKN